MSVKPIGDHTYETTLRLGSDAAGELTEAAEWDSSKMSISHSMTKDNA